MFVTPFGLAGGRLPKLYRPLRGRLERSEGGQDDHSSIVSTNRILAGAANLQANRSDPFARNIRIVQRITPPRRCCEAAGKSGGRVIRHPCRKSWIGHRALSDAARHAHATRPQSPVRAS
jgi:hypothetical protein